MDLHRTPCWVVRFVWGFFVSSVGFFFGAVHIAAMTQKDNLLLVPKQTQHLGVNVGHHMYCPMHYKTIYKS